MTSRTAVPPSPQEVNRKLSIHSTPKSKTKKHVPSAQAVSGTESDSDSMLSPEASVLSHNPPGSSGLLFASSLSQPPLDSIAERHAGGEVESEDDEDEIDEVDDAKGKSRKSTDDSVIKTGYLWKKGERRKTWKKRWFVLRSAHLAYYKSSAEYQLLRLVELSEVHTCTAVTLKKHENTFGIVSPTRTFYLQAKTQPEVQDWVRTINEAREAVQQVSTGGSSSNAPIPIPASGHGGLPALTPPSFTLQGHGITSSESEEGSPTGTRSHPMPYTSPKLPSAGNAKEGPKPLLSGYLMKCGSKRRIWHHRWFVLSGEKLAYSRSHMDSKTHREIPISLVIDALEVDMPSHRNVPMTAPPLHGHHHNQASGSGDDGDMGRSMTFKIVTTKRTLVLCAPSEEEEIKWISAIRALIARRSEAGVVPGDSKPAGSTVGSALSEGKSRKDAIARRLSGSGTGHAGTGGGAEEGRAGP